jgi:DNA-binding response OmpR family regulator
VACVHLLRNQKFIWRRREHYESQRERWKESAEQPPNLILRDLKLRKVDGREVLREVKTDLRTKPVPVVILTSSKEERDVINGYQLGVNSYIQKPVDFDQLREPVKHLGLYWLITNQLPPSTFFIS